jgi:hypothetical protein
MNRSGSVRHALLSTGLSASFALAGCKHIGFEDRPVPVHRGSSTTTSGLVFEELFIGHGPEARPGDDVTFEYTVWLQDGTRVDSTYDRGVAMTVRLGSAPIRAWDEGLVGVRAQGRRRLVVPPPELAYGAKGVEGMIPPNATIVAEILALEIARRTEGETAGREMKTPARTRSAPASDSIAPGLSSAAGLDRLRAAGLLVLAGRLVAVHLLASPLQHSAFGMFAAAGSETLVFLSLLQPKASPARRRRR